jgi:uridine kinase
MGAILVGIAGGTGSGKTTIAQNIMARLPPGSSVLIDHDSYYRPFSHLSLEERQQLNFDHPDALDNDLLVSHLQDLRAGRGVDKPVYNFVTHCREDGTERIEPAPIVIVEGILILADERIRDLLDLKLFVDTDPDIRVLRRVRRDMEQRGRSFQSVREQYYRTVRPMHLQFVEPSKRWADLIVPEGGENTIALDVVGARLMQFLPAGQ